MSGKTLKVRLSAPDAEQVSTSAKEVAPEAVEKATETPVVPRLAYLRVELERPRVGMADFLIRIASPNYDQDNTNTVIVLRGTKALNNLANCGIASSRLIAEMAKRGDKTHNWNDANPEHLAKMLYPHLRFFISNTSADVLKFTTEALL